MFSRSRTRLLCSSGLHVTTRVASTVDSPLVSKRRGTSMTTRLAPCSSHACTIAVLSRATRGWTIPFSCAIFASSPTTSGPSLRRSTRNGFPESGESVHAPGNAASIKALVSSPSYRLCTIYKEPAAGQRRQRKQDGKRKRVSHSLPLLARIPHCRRRRSPFKRARAGATESFAGYLPRTDAVFVLCSLPLPSSSPCRRQSLGSLSL
mmetsp:Transcript_3439/g.7711  ORF Transcript_3439/g.7711 Transcript_3439/m.7711 type:complete len:207 (-) Transcript_3439:122-742(-)